MKINTAFQACMYITIVILIFTLAVNFVSASGFFPVEAEMGFDINESNSSGIFEILTGQSPIGIWAMLIGSSAVALIGSVVLAFITRSTAVIGVYIFSVVFWASYMTMLYGLDLSNYIPVGLQLIATASLIFIWMGAIIGMLSGSG